MLTNLIFIYRLAKDCLKSQMNLLSSLRSVFKSATNKKDSSRTVTWSPSEAFVNSQTCQPLQKAINYIASSCQNIDFKINVDSTSIDDKTLSALKAKYREEVLSLFNKKHTPKNIGFFSIKDFVKITLSNYLFFNEVFIKCSYVNSEISAIEIINPKGFSHECERTGTIKSFTTDCHGIKETFIKPQGVETYDEALYFIRDDSQSNNFYNDTDLAQEIKIEHRLYYFKNNDIFANNADNMISDLRPVGSWHHLQNKIMCYNTIERGFKKVLTEGFTASKILCIKDADAEKRDSNFIVKAEDVVKKATESGFTPGLVCAAGMDINVVDAVNPQSLSQDTLLREIEERIFIDFGVPIELMSKENSSYNNMSSSQKDFYYSIVFPLCDMIYSIISIIINKEYELLTDTETSLAVQQDLYAAAKILSDSRGFTDNDVRRKLGYPELSEEEKTSIANSVSFQKKQIANSANS